MNRCGKKVGNQASVSWTWLQTHRCDITAPKVLQGGKTVATQMGRKQVGLFSTPSSPAEMHLHQLWAITQIRGKKEGQSRGNRMAERETDKDVPLRAEHA